MITFQERLSNRTAWADNYAHEADEDRNRIMYRDICAMLIICVLVTGFIARLAG